MCLASWRSTSEVRARRGTAADSSGSHRLGGRAGNLENALWMYIKNADELLRFNSDHLYTRVLPGPWQAHLGFISAMSWATRHAVAIHKATVPGKDGKKRPAPALDNVVSLHIGKQSTELAWRTGPSSVRGARAAAAVVARKGAR